jgi:hypothetical protein
VCPPGVVVPPMTPRGHHAASHENKMAMVGSHWGCTTTTFATLGPWKGSGQGLGTCPPFRDEVGSRRPPSEEDGPPEH